MAPRVRSTSGRTDDHWRKLRGLRIELRRIQNVVGSLPGVEVAAVIAVGGAVATALAAYVVPPPGRHARP